MEGIISSPRLVISVVIIAGCVSMLYPKLFHPMVMRMFGSEPQDTKAATHPPQHNHMGDPRGGNVPNIDDIKRQMRPGPHPGMRAAAEMNSKQQKSSGRGGLMGVVLPMYAIGIVLYLVYTLFKVFNKQGKGDLKTRKERYNRQKNTQGSSSQLRSGDHSSKGQSQNDEEEHAEIKLNNIEDLLTNLEDKNISEQQMLELQKRLQETEAQMTKIMKAMKNVSTKVGSATEEVEEEEGKENDKTDSENIAGKDESDKTEDGEAETPGVETLKAGKTNTEEENNDNKKDAIRKENVDEEEVEDILLEDKEEEESEADSSVRKRKVKSSSN